MKTHIIEVWGDLACFSRPELKVERWSYPCPTPGAARGIFDAIYCKGWDSETGDSQFYWQVEKIELLREPSYIALRRNEVGSVASVSNVRTWMNQPQKITPIMADDSSQRQQRQTMAISKPHYRLHAHIVPRPKYKTKQAAFDSQFVRRATHGKCFYQPYMGCREFVAFFRHINSLDYLFNANDYYQDLGFMLYDVFDLRKTNDWHASPFISLFKAEIKGGILNVPPYESDAVLKPESLEWRAEV
ncbi:type I-C CRISPR-associated protein Cas5 [candidate division KSB1 bacterium]|nr:type I-C CRISPR-associated protein Cas5 [candidate division KSB1 bacterium]